MHDENYNDIIGLERPRSGKYKPMERAKRAAQFAPFAALTGYDASIKEEARLVDGKLELTPEQLDRLNMQLALLAERAGERPSVVITHFVKDERKVGGRYESSAGELRRIDEAAGTLELVDKRVIKIADILIIESDTESLI